MPLAAQESSPPASATTSTQQTAGVSKGEVKHEERERAFGLVPLTGAVNVKNAQPLTTGEKFKLMVRSQVDFYPYLTAAFGAGVGQAADSPSGYGQGAEGYGKRFGAAVANRATANFFGNFVYASLFKEDPRYFQSGEGSTKSRLFYAIEQEFVAHKDSGGRTFHFANVLGAFTSGGIANAYYPDNDRGAGLMASQAAASLGYGCAGNIFLEFWPDIHRKFFHKGQANSSGAAAPTAGKQ
jgi:hypothetical protein